MQIFVLFIYLFIYLFIHLFIYLFIYLFIHLFIYLFIYLFIHIRGGVRVMLLVGMQFISVSVSLLIQFSPALQNRPLKLQVSGLFRLSFKLFNTCYRTPTSNTIHTNKKSPDLPFN